MPEPVSNYIPQCVAREASRGAGVSAWLLLVGLALAAVGLIFSAPWLASRGSATLSFAIYRAFAGVCHQMGERSFWLGAHPLAVCARCTGVFAGFAACALSYPLLRPLWRTDAPAPKWLALAALPTVADFLINFTGLGHNTHWSRALTGALAGAGLVFYVMPGLVQIAQAKVRASATDAERGRAGRAAGRTSLRDAA